MAHAFMLKFSFDRKMQSVGGKNCFMIGFVQKRANEVSDFFIVFVECKERLRANVMVVKLYLVIFLQTVFQFNNLGE